MRKRARRGGVTVQAISGNHSVFLGLNLTEAARSGCLGFAIHRTDHTENEQYWISGFKTFESVVPNPDPKAFYSSRDHPFQTFYWGDYSAKPAHDYTYLVVPLYGKPKNLHSKSRVEASVRISTSDPRKGTHGVYFNRGVAASQAYENKFGLPPDQLSGAKRTAALKWLSRGLSEAIAAFVAQADSDKFALRAAVYEFTQPDVLAAFKKAHNRGADVEIVYHARDDDPGDHNRKAIAGARLPSSILTKRTEAKIAHNKFIVLCRKGAGGKLTPISVWTGSTNLSEGGIFGHSNVGHEIRDATVAAKFLAFWTKLEGNPDTAAMRDWTAQESPFDSGSAGDAALSTIFSPRRGLVPLEWYAERFVAAKTSAHITLAFGMGKVFETALQAYAGDAMHYVMLEKEDDNQAAWSQGRRAVFVAVGSKGGPDQLTRWAKEGLTGFNSRVNYLHTKILLVDPLSKDPTVITGSANFSPASTSANDENMLVVRGDTELADVYFTEFARMFTHFYARYWAAQLSRGAGDAQVHSFLEEDADWQAPYFVAGNPKFLRRTLYSSRVEGNV